MRNAELIVKPGVHPCGVRGVPEAFRLLIA